MQALMSLLVIPLMLLNMLGGLVSGIWLAILGQWWAIGFGILGLIISRFLIGLALMPSLALSAPAMMLLEKGRVAPAIPLLILNTLYTYGVITAWCMFVFFFFMRSATHESFIPLLIWSYGAATGPWAVMAAEEQRGGSSADGSAIAIFFSQLAYVAVGVTAIFFDTSKEDLTALFSAIMGLAMLLQFALTVMTISASARLRRNEL